MMLLFFFFTGFFVFAYYVYDNYLIRNEKSVTLKKKNLYQTGEKSNKGRKMSDEEFCDPMGAKRRFQQLSTLKAVNEQQSPSVQKRWRHTSAKKTVGHCGGGLFNWKRTLPSTLSGDNDGSELRIIKRSKTSSDISQTIKVIEISSEDESDQFVNNDHPADFLKNSLENATSFSGSKKIIKISDDEDKIYEIDKTSPKSKSDSIECDKYTNEIPTVFMPSDVKAYTTRYDKVPQPPGMPPLIGGTPVKFPVENSPYKSQISVMNCVIQGCKNKENCLIESPTGSGKTLALLCSTLAWQQQEKSRLLAQDYQEHQQNRPGKCNSCEKDMFEPTAWEDEKRKKPEKIPKVFYCTRTHKQLEQVVSELKKTVYRDLQMTVLSSREHTCIQKKQEGMSMTQLCNNLLDPLTKRGCEFNKESKSKWAELESPWDIEDLVQFGREHRSCPYFAARKMMETADVILCPYNYLIDPVIRSSMKIDLKGNVVVIDEAHNIENISRDIASTTFREDYLAEAADDCRAVYKITQSQLYQDLECYVEALISVVQSQKLPDNQLSNLYDEVTSDWLTGQNAWTQLDDIHKLGGMRFSCFQSACKGAFEAYNQMKENTEKNEKLKKKEMSTINFATKKLLEELLMSLCAIQDHVYRDDYRVVTSLAFHRDAKVRVKESTWITVKEKKSTPLRTLKFLCMNPAMIFREVSAKCHSMILASGTLAPTTTFESELGVKFKYKLNANHVISRDQAYVRVIPRGPTGEALKAVYTNVQQLPFKDELGRLIVQVCETVPHGVLCFFSSYNVMNEMIDRWKSTAVWQRLEAVKRIILEPRFSNQIDDVMSEYRNAIQDTSNEPDQCGLTGAVMFAVLRGKVAEGIDFSDNEARCVLTIGIPYPSYNDIQVKMKKEYNDKHQGRGLLRGSDWYNIQAYRALNQALGRCIRHRNDWGAILLVDERLLTEYSSNYLPKWIREMKLKDSNYNLKSELAEFVRNRKQHSNNDKIKENILIND